MSNCPRVLPPELPPSHQYSHGLPAAEWRQWSFLYKADYPFGVGLGVFAQHPANGLIDEEFLRTKESMNDGTEQGAICILLVLQLKEDGGAL